MATDNADFWHYVRSRSKLMSLARNPADLGRTQPEPEIEDLMLLFIKAGG